jgi:hypothetical protein
MVINIKVNIITESFMAEENIHGLMDHVIKVLLMKVLDTDKDIGYLHNKMVIYILALIKMIKNVDLEDILGLMGAYTKEASIMI